MPSSPSCLQPLGEAHAGLDQGWPLAEVVNKEENKSQVAFISGSITGMRWARKSKGKIKLARKRTSSPFLRMEWTTKDDGVEITKQRVENTHLKTEKF